MNSHQRRKHNRKCKWRATNDTKISIAEVDEIDEWCTRTFGRKHWQAFNDNTS